MGDMKKQKKLKTTSIGISKVHVNDVGNPYLHERHKIGIAKYEKGNMGRAIVFDQHFIDVLFKDGDLSARQHSACDKYLGVIVKAMHMSRPQMDERLSTGKYYISPVPRSCILINVQRHLRNECGKEKEARFWILMCDSPKKPNTGDVELVQSCADALLNFYYVNADSPASLFQQALLNPI